MKLMLDTHIFLWWDMEPSRLSPRVLALLQDSNTELIISVASLWEMQIKAQMGKLILPAPLPSLVASHKQANGLRVLPVRFSHVLTLNTLPFHHKDPFDRLLIAQANREGAALASADSVFSLYPVHLVW